MSSSDLPTTSKLANSRRVNNKVIDYYLKYAQDRDIEKFMRLNRSSDSSSGAVPSKSSSGSDELAKEVLLLSTYFSPTQPKPQENKPDKENSIKEANKSSEPQTPPKSAEPHGPESVTKNDKKLEWDSLADVGYKKSNSTGNLSSLERSVLKELFNDSPLVPNTPNTHSLEQKSAESRREKWRTTLETLAKKYSSRSTSHNTQEFMDLPQSTPKVNLNTDKSCQTTFESRRSSTQNPKVNHSCQTSLDWSKDTKETQANLSSRAESFATQSSFEYQAGDGPQSAPRQSSTRRSVLSERNEKSTSTTESDKENRPKTKTHRPSSTTTTSELDLGIKLLCSLIDAKSLSAAKKKHLAKKIFEKISKQKLTSTSEGASSVSSAISIQSLIMSSPPRENKREITTQTTNEQVTEETQTEEQKIVSRYDRDYRPESTTSPEEPVTMREWLHPLTRSERDYEKKLKLKSRGSSSTDCSERTKQLCWIEMEINRLEGLKCLILGNTSPRTCSSESSSTTSRGRPEIIYETAEEQETEDKPDKNAAIYDEPTAEKHPDPPQQPKKLETSESPLSPVKKNHRSKLETPTSTSTTERESVGEFANHLQKQFMDNYKKKKRTTSGEHYSEPRISGKPIFTKRQSYTSVASSSFTMSSEMSIPICESTSTSTTTHQYDSDCFQGVAVQTSYSIIKTEPIFGPRCRCRCFCGRGCRCPCQKPTLRVSGKIFHQTVQVKPKALAYIILFNENSSGGEGNEVLEGNVPLQKRLEIKNPEFYSKANERVEILKKLHALRHEREEKIREIVDSSTDVSIVRKLDELPPPPTKQLRVFPSKEMKGLTQKRYSTLPEVVAKQEREKLERRKKSTRLITNIFNKKLQNMVHKGKLSLEHSRTVI